MNRFRTGWRLAALLLSVALMLPGCTVTVRTSTAEPPRSSITSWTFIDAPNGLNKDPGQDAYVPQISALGGKLYAAWREMTAGAIHLHVAVYNGEDATPRWKLVDGRDNTGINYDSARDGFDIQLTAFNGKLYATWQEVGAMTDHIRVALYNGDDAAPAWSFVDGAGAAGLNHAPGASAGYPQLTVSNAKLYAAWTETEKLADQVRVAVYNGNDAAPAWRLVDGGGDNGLNHDPAEFAYTPQLTVLGNRLYATRYESEGTTSQIRVAAYNGDDSAPAWRFADGGLKTGINKNPEHNGFDPQLTAFNAKLYVTWKEPNGTERGHQIRAAVKIGEQQ